MKHITGTTLGVTSCVVLLVTASALLPKVRLDLVVHDDDADTLVELLAKHARTGTIGDGKIWVSAVDSVLRVRTGDRDRAAV